MRARGNVVEYLSPLLDDTPALSRAEPHATPGLAAGFAVDTPGGFALRRDDQENAFADLGKGNACATSIIGVPPNH